MKKLAIDYGVNKVGFAISDIDNKLSLPFKVLKIKDNDFKSIIEFVKNVLNELQIDTIILGYPLRSNGTKSERTIKIEHFKNHLEKNFNLPIVFINEYGSSIKANNILIKSGFTRKKRKDIVDKIAAQIILEDYLNYYQEKEKEEK